MSMQYKELKKEKEEYGRKELILNKNVADI